MNRKKRNLILIRNLYSLDFMYYIDLGFLANNKN